MRREARSGRRLEDAEAPHVRIIHKVGGLRLWNAHLRVSRWSGQPVVEIRQRPWMGLVVPVLYSGFAVAVALDADEPGARWISSIVLAFVLVMAVEQYLRHRAWARAGPDGLTIRRATQREPRTFPWSEIEMVRITTETRFREYVMTVAVVSSGPNPMVRPMKLLHPLSVRRSHLLGLVLLATSHRYGASGLYLGETQGWGWRERSWRRRPLARDERYLRPRTPPGSPFG
jgi:hypothetical protein